MFICMVEFNPISKQQPQRKDFAGAFAVIDSVRKSRRPLGEQIEERLREKGLM